MSLREHILDQLTGPDIPVRNSMLFHGLDPLITKTFSLTDTLHDRKRKATFHSFSDKVDHNIVSGTDSCGNGCLTLLDQHLGITQPYIRTMRKPCNTDQVREVFRLGVNKHLHGEICTKFRDSQTSELTSANIFRFNFQSLCTCKQ